MLLLLLQLLQAAEAEAIDAAFPKGTEELSTADGWVHSEFELNKLGRVRALPEVEEGAEGSANAAASTEEPPEEVRDVLCSFISEACSYIIEPCVQFS